MKEIEITLTDHEIEPREIRVPARETVRLLVINFGSKEHRFCVEAGQCGVQVAGLKPGQTKALEHAFTEPGSFKTASYNGQEEAFRVSGSLVVEA